MDENIEIKNAKEEISEIVDICNKCGLCKEIDPVFRALREESFSNRGKAILFSEGIFDKEVFDDTLSGTCKEKCPFNIDLDNAVRKARNIVNLKGKENSRNKEILRKIKNKENPFSD